MATATRAYSSGHFMFNLDGAPTSAWIKSVDGGGVKSEVVNWVLRKPLPEQRNAIDDCIARSMHTLPFLLSGDVAKATMLLHTRPAQQNAPDKGG